MHIERMRTSEALHQYGIGDSRQDSACATDIYSPSLNIYLGIAPPECDVSELRLHKTPAWAMLLFCYSLMIQGIKSPYIERFCHKNVNQKDVVLGIFYVGGNPKKAR